MLLCKCAMCSSECNEIVTEQSVSVCGSTLVLLQTVGWFVLCGRGTTDHCLTSRSVLYTKAGTSCLVLAKGPSNGSIMARQTMLFGTVVEKGQFFKGLPSAEDHVGYYAVVVEVLWTLDCIHCVCN